MKRKIIFLVLVLILAAFFRLWRLDQVPPSPSLDEVSIGWNAYSILKTGADEYGYRWPVLLRAYDDWRPALYVYLTIPFIKLFGLSVIAIRLPSVILALISIMATYFLIQELFNFSKYSAHYGLLASFFLAISPWQIYLSRLGHEVNAGQAFTILAAWFFLRAVNHRSRGLFLSAFFFALSLYTYQTQRIFTPLLVMILLFLFRKTIIAAKKPFFISLILGIVLLLPLLKPTLSAGGTARFQATSIFQQNPELYQLSADRVARDYQNHHYWALILDNRRVVLGLEWLRNYFSHFNPVWLFFNQGAEDHKIPGLGILWFWQLPLIIIGLNQLWQKETPKKTGLLILSWLLVSPLAASLATQAPHAMRTLVAEPMPSLLTAMGMVKLWQVLEKKRRRILMIAGSVLIFSGLLYLFHQYFHQFPVEQSGSFQYPLAQALKETISEDGNYQKIIVTNQKAGYQSYMFYLFFSGFDPLAYQRLGGTGSGGYSQTHKIGKYEFRPLDWHQERREKGVLYLGNFDEFPSSTTKLKEYYFLSGQPGLVAVEGGF